MKKGGNPPRTKGRRFEQEVCRIASLAGKEARRTPCSLGIDVWLNGQKVSCKRRKRLPAWIINELKAGHDYVLMRQDGDKTIYQVKVWRP